MNRPSVQRLDDDAERLRGLYQCVYQRDPAAKEVERGLRFLRGASPSAGADDRNPQPPLTPLERLAQVLLMSNELMFVD